MDKQKYTEMVKQYCLCLQMCYKNYIFHVINLLTTVSVIFNIITDTLI